MFFFIKGLFSFQMARIITPEHAEKKYLNSKKMNFPQNYLVQVKPGVSLIKLLGAYLGA